MLLLLVGFNFDTRQTTAAAKSYIFVRPLLMPGD